MGFRYTRRKSLGRGLWVGMLRSGPSVGRRGKRGSLSVGRLLIVLCASALLAPVAAFGWYSNNFESPTASIAAASTSTVVDCGWYQGKTWNGERLVHTWRKKPTPGFAMHLTVRNVRCAFARTFVLRYRGTIRTGRHGDAARFQSMSQRTFAAHQARASSGTSAGRNLRARRRRFLEVPATSLPSRGLKKARKVVEAAERTIG